MLLSARYNSGLFVDSLHVSKFGYGTWFPESKGSRVGRGVKEKQHANGCGYSSGNGGALSFSDAMHSSSNDSTPSSGDAMNTQLPTANIAVTDTLGNSIVNKKDNVHDENDGLKPTCGFFLGKRVAYPVVANYVGTLGFIRNNPLILKKWNPDVNLLKEDVGNVPGRSSYARALIEVRADVELKDNIVVAMPKLVGEGF
ncbi:hypothetical protein Tco_0284894 [Tanacetum coccineum]